jgi:hypothetical protein
MLYYKAKTYKRYSSYLGVFYNSKTRVRPI